MRSTPASSRAATRDPEHHSRLTANSLNRRRSGCHCRTRSDNPFPFILSRRQTINAFYPRVIPGGDPGCRTSLTVDSKLFEPQSLLLSLSDSIRQSISIYFVAPTNNKCLLPPVVIPGILLKKGGYLGLKWKYQAK